MKIRLPNILITGTPGTGKSTLSSAISEQAGLEWINVGDFAEANNLFEEYDETFQCHVLDEDQVVSELEDKILEGGKIVDYHGCDFFPESWFDIVFVLTTDNTVLFDRLQRRGYSSIKIKNNIEAEIFQTLLEEARDAYRPSIVHALKSDTPDDMEANVEQICQWVENFKSNPANAIST